MMMWVDLFALMFATFVSTRFVDLEPFLFVTTYFWRCELFLAYPAVCIRVHYFLVRRDTCYGLLAISFRSLFFGEAESFCSL